MTAKRAIEKSDIMDYATYRDARPAYRKRIIALKKDRRVALGPNATAHFESFDTMLYQVQEMLHTERGGAEQLADELAAYQPMIPGGNELVCTLMLEYENPVRRTEMLSKLGGIEDTIALEFDGETIHATAENEVERTTSVGKTSAIHFLHFHFNDAQVAKFSKVKMRVILSVGHSQYPHMTVMTEYTRSALAVDL